MMTTEMNENEGPNKESGAFPGTRRDRFKKNGGRHRRWLKVPMIISIVGVVILVKSAVFALVWNNLIPDLFHGPQVTYLQAIGLMVLAKLLVGFGGRGGHRSFGGGFGRGFGSHKGWMMKEVWSRLPDDERQKLREEMRARWSR